MRTKRKKTVFLIAALLLTLLLSACAENAQARAERYARPKIDAALQALEAVRRDELSRVSFAFDPADAYTAPTEAQKELYGAVGGPYSESDRAYFEEVCRLAAAAVPQDASTYDKYRYLAYFVSACVDYDLSGTAGLMSVTPYGAIVGGKAVCLGYTNCYLYLCQKADLWCQAVSGYASWNGEDHGWNLVKLEDGTYYVDVTWCDQEGVIGSKGWQSYFMLTEAVLTQDHGVSEGGPATGRTIFG
jgi:hypothetical protein